ncbi:substrate-binding periplasmic protein [Pseudodesulfovibrio sediminis]|uniref:ABC transporter substrate-binding protein n=1 Tax=Pseudodesulfovibrio sediminis TaxID=2810563 RepID=A0ABM7P9G5_9BACT|nr:transporter substrate-binding domain-containing protein [Pseudodesulfovibrio sediminis]BCS89603.1 ABC transporter substrate-binding protein [Pseudodesulfovibrio sediminis]
MIQRLSVLCGLCLLFTVCLWSPGRAESILLTTGEWPPYYSASMLHGGIANQIVAESFALVGIDVQFQFLPWKRALVEASQKPYQGSAGWLWTPEREETFLFSYPLFSSSRVFFHRKDFPFDWNTLEDLRNLRIAVTLGSEDEFSLKEIVARGKGEIDVAQTYRSGLKKLLAGRVHVYACNREVGLHILRNEFEQYEARLLTFHLKSIFEETNHLLISKRLDNANELMERFNEGLRQLRESGRYYDILDTFYRLEPGW